MVDALGAGIDSFSTEDRTNVKKAREAVRLDEKLAKKILADTARKCVPLQHAYSLQIITFIYFSNSNSLSVLDPSRTSH